MRQLTAGDSMDDRNAERMALNEAVFRAANEQLHGDLEAFTGSQSSYSMMCECALIECEQMVEMDEAAYTRVRSKRVWFLVWPEHVVPEIEDIVERSEGFWIVEKVGAAASVARSTAPEERGERA